ncbi:MAG: PA14 domain-containing protein [Planctomycetes bacterium]|nr:PA14 domain-containing protein [Planctomycetota bacterium]
MIRFEAQGRLRVKFGDELKATAANVGEQNNMTTLDFELPMAEERYIPFQIDWVNEGGPASLQVSLYSRPEVYIETSNTPPGGWWLVEQVPAHLFFPPVVPPSPPVIRGVSEVLKEGEEPLELPYKASTDRPSVREGHEIRVRFRVMGTDLEKYDYENMIIVIDGKRFNGTYSGAVSRHSGLYTIYYTGILPTGLGEGRMVARLGTVTSAPFIIDIQNKGLIAYYYDLPNTGGISSMPDLEPLACFAIRKNSWINFENANDFNLPFPAETFAIQWLGAIIIEEDGFYTFTTRSDDGSKVWVDGNVVVDANNLQYQREKSGEPVFLAAGTYTFRMDFFENNGLETCELMWQAKDNQDNTIIEKQTVSKRAFTWPEHPALPNKQATGKRTDGSDPE